MIERDNSARDANLMTLYRAAQFADKKGFKEFHQKMSDDGK